MIYIGDIVEWEGEECIVTNVNRTYVEIYTGNNQIVSVPKKKKLRKFLGKILRKFLGFS